MNPGEVSPLRFSRWSQFSVYRASRDLFLAQRFARHASPLTTTIYTHPSDEELREGVRNLVC